jgi:RNA polymerase sigma factor (sigma-70 family)
MNRQVVCAVLDQVRGIVDPAESADPELLRRFVANRDEAAFEALVRRHGPLVYGLCRRLVDDGHLAEDVFQAAFLVLARKAATVRMQDALASWLYGVTTRLARNARRQAGRRRRHEISAVDLPCDQRSILDRGPEALSMSNDPANVLAVAEVGAALDEELARLPDKYRAPLLLCGCVGKTACEAARALNCPEATLKSRLRRGRELLRGRLAQRGFLLSEAAVGALFTISSAGAVTPLSLLTVTTRAALPFVAGRALAGCGHLQAVLLAEDLLRKMAVRHFGLSLLAALTLALSVSTAMVLGWQPVRDGSTNAAASSEPDGRQLGGVDLHASPLPPGALARLGDVRWRHGAMATFVAFTPDGKHLVSAGADGCARLWDMATGKEVRRIELTSNLGFGLIPIALSADGRTLAGCIEESVGVWDVTTGKAAAPLKEPPPAGALLALDRNGKTLAVLGQDGSLALWDLASDRRVRQLRAVDEGVGAFALGGHGSLLFSPDGADLVTTQFEMAKGEFPRSVLRAWDIAAGKERFQITGSKETNGAFTPCYSPEGKRLGWSGMDGVVHLVDAASGKEMQKLRTEGGAVRFAFSADGLLVTRNEVSRVVAVWELASGKELRTFAPEADSPGIAAWGFAGVVQSMALSPDSRTLALAGEGCAICLMDLQTGAVANVTGGHRATVSALTYLAGGKEVVSRGNDGVICIWNASTGKKIGAIKVPRDAMTYILSPDAATIATTGFDCVPRLWDARSGQERSQLPQGVNGLVQFEFAPDGQTLAVTDPGNWSLRLYDVASGKRTLSLPLSKPGEASPEGVQWAGSAPPFFSANGRHVAACTPTMAIVVWDARTGREVQRLPAALEGSPPVMAACFSPDARTLALERVDGSLVLWELATSKERARLGEPAASKAGALPGPGIGGPARNVPATPFFPSGKALAYSSDGRFLVQVGGRAVRLWDLATRKEIGQFRGHFGDIAALACSPDGRILVTGASDGTALVWDMTRLTARATRPTTTIEKEAQLSAWQALAEEDAVRAFQGITTLVIAAEKAAPFLRDRLEPARVPNKAQMARWVRELDSDDFAARQKATTALRQVGPAAGPTLRKALASKPSPEVKRGIEVILSALDQAPLTGDELRAVRAIEALEMVHTLAAREVVARLAGGAPGAQATEAAKAALERMDKASGIASAPGKSGAHE